MTISIGLRTQHVHYLEYLAEETGVSLSEAFGMVLEKQAALALAIYRPQRKRPKHLTIEPRHADILDRLAVRAGLFKADIARRLLDEAMRNDETLIG